LENILVCSLSDQNTLYIGLNHSAELCSLCICSRKADPGQISGVRCRLVLCSMTSIDKHSSLPISTSDFIKEWRMGNFLSKILLFILSKKIVGYCHLLCNSWYSV